MVSTLLILSRSPGPGGLAPVAGKGGTGVARGNEAATRASNPCRRRAFLISREEPALVAEHLVRDLTGEVRPVVLARGELPFGLGNLVVADFGQALDYANVVSDL